MKSNGSVSLPPVVSICTTNYNCGDVIESHLASVFEVFDGIRFEYIAVDSHSNDGSWRKLRQWAEKHENVDILRRKCTKGIGRNLAVQRASSRHLVIVDSDVVYRSEVRELVLLWLAQYATYAVEAPFLGLYPRDLWQAVGGRRSLNVYEDADMWWRVQALGKMLWCPLLTGENVKEPFALGSFDHLSSRYSRPEKIVRVFRREWDLWKTREYEGKDLCGTVALNTLIPGFGTKSNFRLSNRVSVSMLERWKTVYRLIFQVLRS